MRMTNHHLNSNTRTMLLLAVIVFAIILAACGGADHSNRSLGTPTPTHSPAVQCDDYEVEGQVRCVDGNTGLAESAIYPGSHADYHDHAWWVDGVKVTGVDCPTEDSCYPMTHPGGIMIHEEG
jgi:hypothetical protein